MTYARGFLVTFLLLTISVAGASPGAAAPEGQMTWAVHVSLAPTWFDPAETSGIITPFLVLYALHDAVTKPMPGQPMAPSLAESWTTSPDGLVYEFVLHRGARFHNGDPVTAEKVLIAPIWLSAGMNGVGPRVEESGLGLIAGYAFSAPYEDVKLKAK
jgi:peptide/nickel transport system substrate-binding protein